jgi:hypothetical protein
MGRAEWANDPPHLRALHAGCRYERQLKAFTLSLEKYCSKFEQFSDQKLIKRFPHALKKLRING